MERRGRGNSFYSSTKILFTLKGRNSFSQKDKVFEAKMNYFLFISKKELKALPQNHFLAWDFPNKIKWNLSTSTKMDWNVEWSSSIARTDCGWGRKPCLCGVWGGGGRARDQGGVQIVDHEEGCQLANLWPSSRSGAYAKRDVNREVKPMRQGSIWRSRTRGSWGA